MNYKIRKNEELADFNYLCKTFVAALHTNKSSFVLKVGTIHMISIYQFFPQIDQFLLYWQIRQKQFVFRHVNWSSRDQCT
jgi:hypothetical protein